MRTICYIRRNSTLGVGFAVSNTSKSESYGGYLEEKEKSGYKTASYVNSEPGPPLAERRRFAVSNTSKSDPSVDEERPSGRRAVTRRQ